MSIIYDALKKVEESSGGREKLKINKGPAKSRPKHKPFLLYLLIGCLGILLANIFFIFLPRPLPTNTLVVLKNQPKINDKLKPPVNTESPKGKIKENETQPIEPAFPLPVEAEKEPKGPFVLSGVFFSNDEGYALINNRIVKEGDKVDGATVTRVALGEAELELNGKVLKLSSNSQ